MISNPEKPGSPGRLPPNPNPGFIPGTKPGALKPARPEMSALFYTLAGDGELSMASSMTTSGDLFERILVVFGIMTTGSRVGFGSYLKNFFSSVG
jgi:hypothetical protein